MKSGAIQVQLEEGLQSRLEQAASERSLTVPQLVEQILKRFVEADDDPHAWTKATQQQLPKVWQKEDFSSWNPPAQPTPHGK